MASDLAPKLRKPLSPKWTAEDRLRVVAAMLQPLAEDVRAGKYGGVGRPNFTSLQHAIYLEAEILESGRAEAEKLVAEHEAALVGADEGGVWWL